MKKRLVAVLAFALVNALPASAQTWSGALGDNWTTNGNWVGGTAPPSSGPATAVVFPGSATSFTPVIDSSFSVNALSITTPGYSFSGSVLDFGGINPTLTVGFPGSSMANTVSFSANTTLDNAADFFLSGGMAGSANLVKTGAGTLHITGFGWHSGATTVAAGTLQLGDGLNFPANVRAINNVGSVVFDGNTIGLQGAFTGSGSVTVLSGGRVTNISGIPMTHQGSTTLNGVLDVFSSGIQSNGAVFVASTGEFSLSTDSTVGSIAGSGRLNNFGGINSVLTVGGNDTSTTFTGLISGNGGLRKTGTGTFTLATTSMFNGPVIVDGGTLRYGDGTNGPNFINDLTVNSLIVFELPPTVFINGPVTGTGAIRIEAGTTLSHNSSSPLTHQGLTTVNGGFVSGVFNTIDNNGPVVIGPAGSLQVNQATIGSLAGSGTLVVNNPATLTAGGDNTSTTYSGNIIAAGNFRKRGSGTTTFATNSWFSGDTTIEAPGTLRIGNGVTGPGGLSDVFVHGLLVFDTPSLSLGGVLTGTGSVRVEAGSSVFNSGGSPISHQGSTTVNGLLDASAPTTSIDTAGALVIGPLGTFTTRTGQVGSLSGSGTLNVMAGIFTVGGDNSSTTYSGAINGTGEFRKIGSGSLTLATTSFFGADVTVEAPGILRLGNGATGPSGAQNLLVDGTIFFNTPNITISGALSGNGNVTIQSGSLVNVPAFAPMTHTGTTIVSGTLTSAGAAIDNNAPLLLSGALLTRGGNVGSLTGSGSVQLTGPGTFSTGGNNLASTFAGVLLGTGTFAKVGTGTLILSGNSTGFSGLIQVASGTLQASGPLGTSGLNVATGATLIGTGPINGPVNVELAGTVAPGTSPGILATGNFSLSGTLLVEVLGTSPGTQHDQVSVTGNVALNGGTLTLSGGYIPVTGNTLTIIANDGTDPVVGTFAGLPEGATLTFNGVTLRITYAGGTGNDVVLSVANYTVTPSAGANGTISPSTPQPATPGRTVVFTLNPTAGYTPSVGGTCGGNLVGNTYTTNPVNADCTVVASFTLSSYIVTPSAGAGGTISPSTPQPVAPGGTLVFTLAPNSGFSPAVGGTCGGNLVGNTYTTNAVNANCTVSATFAATSYTVTPSAGANGVISPSTPQSVPHGTTTTFTVTPSTGYVAVVGGTCGGTLAGTSYVTNAITASCTVTATFSPTSAPRLVNIAGRMQVGLGDNVMIAGFIIGGSAPKTVLVRGRGPSLVQFGLPDALRNPQLTLYSDQTVIGSNDNWQDASNSAQVQATGLAPGDPLDSAILVTLNPGAYTAIVSGVGGLTGIGIVEVFEVDAPTTPLVNISTRGLVGVGDQVIIAGLIIEGTGPQQVAVRARGPSLTAFGVPGVLANPAMTLVRSSDQAVIGVNDNWGDDSNAAALTASGFAPTSANEAAMLVTLVPGAYTVIVNGVGNTTGVAIVEVFAVP